MSTWLFELTDKWGNAIGELQDMVGTTVVDLPLNRIDNGNFTIRTDNPFINTVRQGEQTHIKAYRDGTLEAAGPLAPGYQKNVAADAQGGGSNRTCQVYWSGIGWRLSRRLIESSKSATGKTYGTPTSLVDRGQMVVQMLTELNQVGNNGVVINPGKNFAQGSYFASFPPADTGIRIGSVPVTSSTTVGPWYYKNVLQAIMELSATLDGFDWRIFPTEPTEDQWGVQWGTFSCALAFGQTQTNAVFEYGDGAYNVASYTELGDWSGVLNKGYSLPNSFPNATVNTVLLQEDTDSENTLGTIYEDTVPSDLVTDAMRAKNLQQNIAVRKYPKTVITFQPVADLTPGVVPQYGIDYGLGDLVTFRAVENGVETVNGLFRVYEVQFNIDAQGMEIVTPILISQDASNSPVATVG